MVHDKETVIAAQKAQLEEQNVKVAQLTLQVDEQAQSPQNQSQVEDLQDVIHELRAQLTEKDTALLWMKRRLPASESSPKRGGESVPLEDLKLLRTYQKMVNSAASMECEFCRRVVATQGFMEHLQSCKAESLEMSGITPAMLRHFGTGSDGEMKQEARIEELEKTLYELRITIGELKNERDKAKLDSEKLLIQLKHVKLDWALADQRTSERELDTKRQIQALLAGLQTLHQRVSKDVGQIVEGLIDIVKDCLARGFKIRSGFSTPLGFSEQVET